MLYTWPNPGIHPIPSIPVVPPRCNIYRVISWVIAWNMSDLIGWRKCVLYKVLESAPDSAYLPINQPGLASAHCCHCDQTKYLNTRIRPGADLGSNTTDRQITTDHFKTETGWTLAGSFLGQWCLSLWRTCYVHSSSSSSPLSIRQTFVVCPDFNATLILWRKEYISLTFWERTTCELPRKDLMLGKLINPGLHGWHGQICQGASQHKGRKGG